METVYTHAVWRVTPGREEDFIRLWQSLAEQTLSDFPDAVGTLLRDQTDPSRFVSFGSWQSVEQVAEWRGSPAFKESVAALREVLESFEPGTYDLVKRAGA